MQINLVSLLFSGHKACSSASFIAINAWINKRVVFVINLRSRSKEMHLNGDLKALVIPIDFFWNMLLQTNSYEIHVFSKDGPFLWDRDDQKRVALEALLSGGKFLWSLRGRERKWTSVPETQIVLVLGWAKSWFRICENTTCRSKVCFCYHCALWKNRIYVPMQHCPWGPGLWVTCACHGAPCLLGTGQPVVQSL